MVGFAGSRATAGVGRLLSAGEAADRAV